MGVVEGLASQQIIEPMGLLKGKTFNIVEEIREFGELLEKVVPKFTDGLEDISEAYKDAYKAATALRCLTTNRWLAVKG